MKLKLGLFVAMVRTLRACLPAVAVLENVIGIKRVLPKVWKSLRSLQWYEVLTVKIDPLDMGEPVARPRIFFLLIRVDVAKAHGRELDELATRLLNVGLLATKVNLSERLLPSSSPLVQHWLAKRAKRQPLAATQGIVGNTPRQHKLLATGLANSGGGSLREGVYIDVSQSVGRSRVRKHCPVVTPGSRIVLGEMRRLMIPIEKCLIHLVPVHRLSWPSSLTDNAIADLGGNTMHLLAAGALACRGALCRRRAGRGHGGRPGRVWHKGVALVVLRWAEWLQRMFIFCCWWWSSFLAHVVIVTVVTATSGTAF